MCFKTILAESNKTDHSTKPRLLVSAFFLALNLCTKKSVAF